MTHAENGGKFTIPLRTFITDVNKNMGHVTHLSNLLHRKKYYTEDYAAFYFTPDTTYSLIVYMVLASADTTP